jgi:hypothetical protein
MERVKLLLQQYKHTYSDFEYYHLHIEKIENNKSKNPDIAIESCKSLIEGVSKSVLNRLDISFDEKKESSGKNPRSVQWFFKKALEKIADKSEEFEASFVSSSGQIINIISEIRTKRGDISHGKSVPKLEESSPEFAEMVTNMTDLIVSYTLKHFFQIDTTSKEKLDYFPKDEEIPTEEEETILQYNTYLDESQPDFPISTTNYSLLLYENDYDEYETRFYDEFLKTLESEEVIEETDKEEPKVIIEVNNPTIEHLVKEFFADVFWTEGKNDKLIEFSKQENLKETELKQVINFYLDEEKEPFPDSIKETMVDKPSLLEFRKIKRGLTQKIVEFAKSLNNELN